MADTETPSLYERLRARGWRMTAQRRAVARALEGEHVHLTADEVFRRARSVLPEVSLATVYNTLGDMVAMGELREVVTGRGAVRYDPNAHDDHSHLSCVGCGRLWDVEVDTRALAAGAGDGVDVLGVDVVLRVRCADCRG